MQLKFEEHLNTLVPFPQQKNWLIAVSGGLDSMTLLHLMYHLKLKIAVAHCNFGLRGEASEQDAQFVSTYCLNHQIPFYVNKFDTQQYAVDHQLSIQMAARALRYSWFEALLHSHGFDFVCTAHHLDDQLETFIINLSRGTGIKGLSGIPALQNKICRPFLNFSREELEHFALQMRILWREDSSNQSDYYLRNKIRHLLTPALKNISQDFLGSFKKTLSHLQDATSIMEDAVLNFQEKCIDVQEDFIYIDINHLKLFQNYRAYLYQYLAPFGFTAWQDIYGLVHAQSGKIVVSNSHQLLKNRDKIILSTLKNEHNTAYLVHKEVEVLNIPLKLHLSKVLSLEESNANTIFVDFDKLVFPLVIRKWQHGDFFCPQGMTGSKKLSKYFKDEKMSLHEKKQIWILCSENQIVWIIGKRLDRRFQVNNLTQTILQITLHS